MIKTAQALKDKNFKSRLILQVHDELNFDVVPEELDRVTDIVTTEMQSAYSGGVPLTASYSYGSNWLEAH